MRSIIILRGLVKQEKLDWVKNEGLDNFFIDIDTIRRLFSEPRLVSPHEEYLSRSFENTVFERFFEVLINRMSRGNLIVIDPEQEANVIIDALCLIFGYTPFYVINKVPKDYLENQGKYRIPHYRIKKQSILRKEVENYNLFNTTGKNIIKHYKDITKYWDKKLKKEIIYVSDKDKLLHISDLHSNNRLLELLKPGFKNYKKVIFHGDYIDGPEAGGSRKIFDFMINTKNNKYIWLEGNHESRIRKYLGYVIFGSSKKVLKDYFYNLLPQDFIDNTMSEFLDIDTPEKAKTYLLLMNARLREFAIISTDSRKNICTHSGLKLLGQLSPKYIGSVIYGNKDDMDRYDQDFTELNKRNNNWSIHAHCKYNDAWNVHKYEKVINLDPPSDNEVVTGEFYNGKWNFELLS